MKMNKQEYSSQKIYTDGLYGNKHLTIHKLMFTLQVGLLFAKIMLEQVTLMMRTVMHLFRQNHMHHGSSMKLPVFMKLLQLIQVLQLIIQLGHKQTLMLIKHQMEQVLEMQETMFLMKFLGMKLTPVGFAKTHQIQLIILDGMLVLLLGLPYN